MRFDANGNPKRKESDFPKQNQMIITPGGFNPQRYYNKSEVDALLANYSPGANSPLSIGDTITGSTASRLLFMNSDNELDDSRLGLSYNEIDVGGGLLVRTTVISQPTFDPTDAAFGFLDLTDVGGAKYVLLNVGSNGGGMYISDGASLIGLMTQDGFQLGSGATINEFSIDGTLAGNSDTAVPTEKAVKTYADSVAGTPGGLDTQLQFNNGGSFGGAKWAYDDSVGTLSGELVAAGSGGSGTQQNLLKLTLPGSSTAVGRVFEHRTAYSLSAYGVELGYEASASGVIYQQDIANSKHIFRGMLNYSSTNKFDIEVTSSNTTILRAGTGSGTLTTEAGTLNLIAATLNLSAGPAIGHANLQLKTSNAPAMYIEGSNNNRRIAIGNNVTASVASKQVHIAASAASYSALTLKAASSHTANILEATDSSNTVLVAIDKVGGILPVSMADSAAQNGTIYYSTTQSKLVYKDSGGTVNNLY